MSIQKLSVEKRLMFVGIFNDHLIAKLLLSAHVREFLKSANV